MCAATVEFGHGKGKECGKRRKRGEQIRQKERECGLRRLPTCSQLASDCGAEW